jgi:hypothetical protein
MPEGNMHYNHRGSCTCWLYRRDKKNRGDRYIEEKGSRKIEDPGASMTLKKKTLNNNWSTGGFTKAMLDFVYVCGRVVVAGRKEVKMK